MKKMIGMKNKSINQVSIINGEDGPTSVFIFGEAQKQSLKIRIRNAIYQSRRKRIEKRIAANPHTLAEVVQYAKDHYDLVEINPAATNWIERQKNLKASLIMQHKPELLGQRKDIPKPDFHNEESVKNFLNEMEIRNKLIDQMPDNVIPMDFHLYEIKIGEDLMEISGFLEVLVSYHGISKLTIAKMAGVEENDIDRLLANPPEKDEIEVKYKIAVTVMELRFWLKDCESPI